jgi:hypothetical protein
MIVWHSGNCIRQRNIQFGCSPGSSSLLFCVNMKVMMIWDFVERWLLTLNTQVITIMMHSLSCYLQIFVVVEIISLFYIIHGFGKLWLSRGLISWVANWRDDEDLVRLEAVSFFSVIAVDCDMLAGSFASILLFELETNFWQEIQLLNAFHGTQSDFLW